MRTAEAVAGIGGRAVVDTEGGRTGVAAVDMGAVGSEAASLTFGERTR